VKPTEVERWFVGVDCGGSGTQAVILDERGGLLATGDSHYCTDDFAAECPGVYAYHDSLGGAGTLSREQHKRYKHGDSIPVQRIGCGTTRGHHYATTHMCWTQSESYPALMCKTSEQRAAVMASSMKFGIIALAGTGSFLSLGPYEEKRHPFFTLGGKGPGIGDEGSAYDIGFQGLRAACWSDVVPTALGAEVAEVLPPLRDGNCGKVRSKPEFHTPFLAGKYSVKQIASLAQVVDKCAEGGDREALRILRQAAGTLPSSLTCCLTCTV